MEAVDAAEVLRRHRHAADGERAFGREHAGEVRCAARTRDDHADAAFGGFFRVLEHFVRHAVCAHDAGFKGDAEVLEQLGGVLHHVPVGIAAHQDADERCLGELCHDYSESLEKNKKSKSRPKACPLKFPAFSRRKLDAGRRFCRLLGSGKRSP